MALVPLRGREDDPAVRALAGPPGAVLVGWEDAGVPVAVAAVERAPAGSLVIRSLAVAPEQRGRGFGRALVEALAAMVNAERLVAETDAAGAGFFERCGFAVEHDDGRYRCVRAIEARAAAPETIQAATLGEVEAAIRSSWGRDTSESPDEWSEHNPARGQCAATALVVRELLGGEILLANVVRGGVRTERHAWNRLSSGVALDLTRSQFRDGEQLEEPSVGEPILLDPSRYDLLARRVRSALGV